MVCSTLFSTKMTNANFLLTIMNTQSREKALRIACSRAMTKGNVLAPVVQTSDSAIHRINHYPADSIIIDFRNTYLVDIVIYLAPVVQTLDSAIHRIKIYPLDGAIGFRNTYPLDSDLSGG